jgi:hypothetical protein
MSQGVVSILTGATCSYACWYAHQVICRCSCGGVNHGVLLKGGAKQPVRQSRIKGVMYYLAGIGSYGEITRDVSDWNESTGWKSIEINYERPYKTAANPNPGPAMIERRYHGRWWGDEKGVPAVRKKATPQQRLKWEELEMTKGWDEVYLLWVRVELPVGDICMDDCPKCEQLAQKIKKWRENYDK